MTRLLRESGVCRNIPIHRDVVYSDRDGAADLQALKPAAADFRIFWDNAYCGTPSLRRRTRHCLLDTSSMDVQKGRKSGYGITNSVSTIQSQLPGFRYCGGSCFLRDKHWMISGNICLMQTIGHDKINQLRHVRFFGGIVGMHKHMKKHAEILRPKFEIVEHTLEKELQGAEIGTWTAPRGGYFISFESMDGCAKKIIAKAAEAGVKMTDAGATYPYGNDPHDSNIRIAPSFPTVEELKLATEIFVLSVKLVSIEKILEEMAA